MSVQALSWVLEESPESVSGRRLVLMVLGNHADAEGKNSCPSVASIGHEAKLTERSARRGLRALELAGAVKAVGTHDFYQTTIYEVVMDGSAGDSAPMSDEDVAAALTRRGGRPDQVGDVKTGGDVASGVPPASGEPSQAKSSSSEDDTAEAVESDFLKAQEPEPDPERLFEAKTESDRAVERVWQHFCEVNNPVRPEISPSQKRMIQRVLKECSEEEAIMAIDGNRASPWHHERGKHALSDIFKPNYSRRETIRSRVDRFIQDAQRAGKGPVVPSVDRGKVQRHKENVIQGSIEGAADHAKTLARESRAWLEANGWQVEFIDGWPRFTPTGEE